MSVAVKVSVVIPVYNPGKYFTKCLESLASQSYNDAEYIFVDDCCTDDSIVTLREFLSVHSDFAAKSRLLTHDTNRGCAAARKTGMQAAVGEYIIHVDSDDYVESDFLEQLAGEAMSTHADVVICDIVKERGNGKCCVLTTPSGKTADYYLALALSGKIYCTLCNKLIRRSLFTANEIWPIEGMDMYDDLSVFVRVLCHVETIHVVKKTLYHLNRSYDNHVSSMFIGIYNKESFKLCDMLKSYLQKVRYYDRLKLYVDFFNVEASADKIKKMTLQEMKDDKERIRDRITPKSVISHPSCSVAMKIQLLLFIYKLNHLSSFFNSLR